MTWTANGSLLAYGKVPLFAVDLWACVGRERERKKERKKRKKERNNETKKQRKQERKKGQQRTTKDNKG
jgi:hypothetical protein